jgi:hypothetical protein
MRLPPLKEKMAYGTPSQELQKISPLPCLPQNRNLKQKRLKAHITSEKQKMTGRETNRRSTLIV